MQSDQQTPTDERSIAAPPDNIPADQAGNSQMGGLGDKLDQVDLEAAHEIGADPPGGLGTTIGGADELGEHDQPDADRPTP